MPYITVIGAANIDIGGTTNATPVPGDSNPGRIRTTLGGVGRNIAHNLCLLGNETKLITVLGDDFFADQIRSGAQSIGLDLTYSAVIAHAATSTYMFFADADGDMRMGINDMGIYMHITPAFLEERIDVINGSALVVLDANLPANSIAWLGEHCTAPILADPVSSAKAGRLAPILPKLYAIKPNRIEAELFTGITVSTEDNARRAIAHLTDSGVHWVFLSLGGDGVIAAERGSGRCVRLFSPAYLPVSANGGGDAMAAVIASCILRGETLESTARYAMAGSMIACEYHSAINPDMSWSAIESRCDLIGSGIN